MNSHNETPPDDWGTTRYGPDADGDYWQADPDGVWWTGQLAQNVYVKPTPLEVVALLVPLLEAEIARIEINYEGADRARQQYHSAHRLLVDLDRNEHGRHQGDTDVGDPTGWSQGNPFALDPDTRLGTTMLGEPITWADLFAAGGPRRA